MHILCIKLVSGHRQFALSEHSKDKVIKETKLAVMWNSLRESFTRACWWWNSENISGVLNIWPGFTRPLQNMVDNKRNRKDKHIVHCSLGLYIYCGTLTLQSSVCIQKPSDQPHWSCLLQIGVVHRDLKLENILLDEDMNVKVTLT